MGNNSNRFGNLSLTATNAIFLWLIGFVFVFSYSEAKAQNAWGDSPYGAYSHFPHGSDRSMAMGGAAVAIIDDPTAVVSNPAAPALANWQVDFGSSNNSISHNELRYNFPSTYGVYETDYDNPYSYSFYSAGVRAGSFVFAGGYSSPFTYDYRYINPLSDSEIERFEVKVQSFDYLVATKIGDNFAVGVAGHLETVREAYKNKSLPDPIPAGFEAKGSGHYFSIGAAFRTESFGLGASASPRRKMTIDNKSYNDILDDYNTTPFRDVVIPARTVLGAFVRPIPRLLLTVDMDLIEKVENMVYVSAATTSTEWLRAEQVSILHGGIEYHAVKTENFDLILRGGAYNEPTRFVEGRDRQHLTYGAEVHLWYLSLSYATDQADNFKSSTYSASVRIY